MPPTRTMRCPSSVRTRQRALIANVASDATTASGNSSSDCPGPDMPATVRAPRKKRTGLGPHPGARAVRALRRQHCGLCQEVWRLRREVMRKYRLVMTVKEFGLFPHGVDYRVGR